MGILPAIFLTEKLHNQKTGLDSWMREQESEVAVTPPAALNEESENA